MRRARIDEQNRYLIRQQQHFRIAADVVTDAWMAFPEVSAVAVIGSVAKRLWKEIPRFAASFRLRDLIAEPIRLRAAFGTPLQTLP